jgi:hypothetical protein
MAGILKVDRVQSDSNLAFNIAGSNVAFMDASTLKMVGSNVSLNGTNVITNGKLVTSGMPVGSVLQVVQGLTTTEVTTSSSSPVDTTIAASITPTSSTSKILIFATIGEAVKTNGNANNRLQLRLYKNGVNMSFNSTPQIMSGNLYTATALQIRGSLGFNYLDSPATTSALEYRLYFLSNDASSSISVQNNSSPSTIILMEIAA